MLNINFVTPPQEKGTALRKTASYDPSCVKINLLVYPVEDGKKRKGTKSRRHYISPIRGEAPRVRIFTKFCTSGDMPDVIICANFGSEKLSALGYTEGQILESPIKMVGYPYNRAACDMGSKKNLGRLSPNFLNSRCPRRNHAIQIW